MRKIERHHSGEGSVIYYRHFGKPSKLFVADAKWRNVLSFASSSQLISSSRAFSSKKFFGPKIINKSDRRLWKQFAPLKGDLSAKENTDLLMKYDTDAAHWCRSVKSYELGEHDLPTLYQLMILYQEADRIDALDPTVEKYSMFALGQKGTFWFGGYQGAWSSTIIANAKIRGSIISLNEFRPYVLGNAFVLDMLGDVNVFTLNDELFCVIPVKELPV